MQSAAHAVEPTSKLSRCSASADRWVSVSNRHLRRVTRPPVDSCDPPVCGQRSAVEVATPTPSRVNSDHVASDPCRPTPILRIARIYAGSVELRGIEPLTSSVRFKTASARDSTRKSYVPRGATGQHDRQSCGRSRSPWSTAPTTTRPVGGIGAAKTVRKPFDLDAHRRAPAGGSVRGENRPMGIPMYTRSRRARVFGGRRARDAKLVGEGQGQREDAACVRAVVEPKAPAVPFGQPPADVKTQA